MAGGFNEEGCNAVSVLISVGGGVARDKNDVQD